MKYKISDLSKLASISTRTLRHYDQIGLLTSKRDRETRYRFYDDVDIDMLQQILLLKAMDIKLSDIKKIIDNINPETRITLLSEHLLNLLQKKDQINILISTIKKTIQTLKGEITMSPKEKFIGLKDEMINLNDALYQDEVKEKWGDDAYQKSNQHFKNMNEEQFNHFNQLNDEIINSLVLIKETNDLSLAKKVATLHKEWITLAWGFYQRDIHFNVVDMYINDERFKKYYDKHGNGLAQILRDAVYQYI
ncbi:MAG: TipAS antibiotic-recognition domain-containing protein [Acholeplasma sp.]|nr:TipAS antibiotic-recognition domain-containing protein [Acholeplasma sp.]